jgi:NAD-reducing hydrogenase small subunit
MPGPRARCNGVCDMAKKVTIASDWLAGCAGCHMSLLDMDDRLIGLLDKIQLTATPITDLKHPAAEGVDVGIIEGAVNNSSTEETLLRMRSRCKCLIAMGDCAVFGGVPAMRNGACLKAALQRAYVESESTVDGKVPEHEDLAVMQDCRAIDQVVPVDVYLPGCPPSADAIVHVIKELLEGRKPQLKGVHLDWH